MQELLWFAATLLIGSAFARQSHGNNAAHTRGLEKVLHLNGAADRMTRERAAAPTTAFYAQQVDHFNSSDNRSWKQQFQTNQTYFEKQHPDPSVVFLVLGGEGPASAAWLETDTAVMSYAATFNAAVIQLEHRFYGNSQPFGDLSTEHLGYLSSRQALADANAFVQNYVFSTFGADAKVISFGGSYSGALSAWLRQQYPTSIYGAIATSAPILARENFVEYQEVVATSLKSTANGPDCVSAIEAATRDIGTRLNTTAGLAALSQRFNTCKPIVDSAVEVSNFMSSLASSFDGVVQYNDDNREFEHPGSPPPIDMSAVCATLAGSPDPGAAYTKAQDSINNFTGSCFDVSYAGFIAEMQNTSLQSDVAGGSRQWVWQTCTEFGYYQSSDGAQQPFGSDFPIGFSTAQCTAIYGVPEAAIATAVANTNQHYGGLAYTGTRVLFVNGDVDPWHALSMPPKPAGDFNGINSVMIQGTAHCANMYPASPKDVPGLTKARATITDAIKQWVTSPAPPPPPPTPPKCFPAGCVPDGIKKKFAKKDCCSDDGKRDDACKGSHWRCQ